MYQDYKKLHSDEDDQFALDSCNLQVDETSKTLALKNLWEEYTNMHAQISEQRETAKE